MKYESLYADFVSLFPEDKDVIQQFEKKNTVFPAEDGMHILFGFVVVPFVSELIKTDDDDKIRRSFNFFEDMALSESEDIGEVLDFTILEDFISRGNDFLEKCKSYMGQRTLEDCKSVEEWFIIGKWSLAFNCPYVSIYNR